MAEEEASGTWRRWTIVAASVALAAILLSETNGILLPMIALTFIGAASGTLWWAQSIFGYTSAALAVVFASVASSGQGSPLLWIAVVLFAIISGLVFANLTEATEPSRKTVRITASILILISIVTLFVGLAGLFGPTITSGGNSYGPKACGNVISVRDFKTEAGPEGNLSAAKSACSELIADQVAVSIALVALAILFLSLAFLLVKRYFANYKKMAFITAIVLLIAIAATIAGSIWWSNATVKNARNHNESFRPLRESYFAAGLLMDEARSSLVTAQKNDDREAVIAACKKYQAAAEQLVPSRDLWPKKDDDSWRNYVDTFTTDATECETIAKTEPTKAQSAFVDSSRLLTKLLPDIRLH